MKEEIKKFQTGNGGVNYTIKELIQGLHTKIDDGFKNLNEKVDKKVSWKVFSFVVGGLSTLFIALLYIK